MLYENKRKKLIKDYSYLLWWMKEEDKLNISDEVLVEMILNNGDWKGVQRLIKIMGIKKVSEIFYKQTSRNRTNYRKEIKYYFNLYFKKYAS